MTDSTEELPTEVVITYCESCGDHENICGDGDMELDPLTGKWELIDIHNLKCANCDYDQINGDEEIVPIVTLEDGTRALGARQPGFVVLARNTNTLSRASDSEKQTYLDTVHRAPTEYLYTAHHFSHCMDKAAEYLAKMKENTRPTITVPLVIALRLPDGTHQFPEGTDHLAIEKLVPKKCPHCQQEVKS